MSEIDSQSARNIDGHERLSPIRPAAGTPAAVGPSDNPAFSRLLERLQELAPSNPATATSAGELSQALRRADDEYSIAMDLRRRLEDAFHGRSSLPLPGHPASAHSAPIGQ